MKLLLVEDDPVVAVGLTWGLTHDGHRIVHSHLARPVIGLIHHHKPDAVIIDVSLPDLDGITLGRLIRHSWPQLPILFATGHDDYEGLAEATSNPWTACLRKPFSIEELEKTLRALCAPS